ncbi:MAG: hypothetical protein ACQEQG_05470 [Bacillota bacterium]
MLKKAAILMLVLMIVFTFSLSTLAESASVEVLEDGSRVIENPADPEPDSSAETNGEGQGPHNPIYVAGK